MSVDVDITADDDPVYASLTISAGVVRVFIGRREPGASCCGSTRRLSNPISTDRLEALAATLKSHLDVRGVDDRPSTSEGGRCG